MYHVVLTRRPHRSRLPTIAALLVLLLTALLSPAHLITAANGRPQLWVTNGPVYSVAVAEHTLYLGGGFTQVGPATGSFVGLDAVSGARDAAVPGIAGPITAAAPDGQGGWYLGIQSASLGNTRVRLAHIRADKTLDLAWHPVLVGSSLVVFAMAANSSTVYIGGQFTSVNGQPRVNLAAVDALTGQVKPWNVAFNAHIQALAATNATLYVSGSFQEIGGQPRQNLAALDTTTNTNNATAWNPRANDAVYTLALSGTLLYAGGPFSTIGGQPRNSIAALDTTVNTDNATAWNPDASSQFGSAVFGLAVYGTTVYAGGQFTHIGGQDREYIAALGAATGQATPWNPGTDGFVSALAVRGATVFAGGSFQTIGGQARDGLAALDATTGQATPWNPGVNGTVLTMALDETTLYIGGEFTGVGGLPRAGIAAIDLVPQRQVYLPLVHRY